MAKREITENVILKLDESGNGSNKTIIRVVQWNGYAPVLEKRSVFEGEDGEWRNGKAKGFNADDFKLILKNKVKIEKALIKKG